MKRRLTSLTMIVITLTGCSMFDQGTTATEVEPSPSNVLVEQPIEPTQTPSPHVTASPSITLTPTPTPTKYTGGPKPPIRPRVEKICPTNPEVDFMDLGFDPSLRLIVRPNDAASEIIEGVYIVSNLNPSPELIPFSVPTDGWTYYGFYPILGGKWLESIRCSEDCLEEELWLSTLDGEVDTKVTTLLHKEIGWVFNEGIVITGDGSDFYGDWRDDMPVRWVSLDGSEVEVLPPLPEGAIFYAPFFFEESLYAIYYKGLGPYEEIALYSYEEDVSIPVYPWLLHQDGVDFHSTSFGGVGGEDSVFVTRDYGFDFAPGFSMEESQQDLDYDEVMQKVLLPEDPTYDYERTVLHGILNEQKYLFSRSDKNHDKSLFLLDLRSNILFDYCLTIPFERPAGYRISPDGQYLAITMLAGPGGPGSEKPFFYAEETIVIDLQTGFRASLGPLRVVGWAVVPD